MGVSSGIYQVKWKRKPTITNEPGAFFNVLQDTQYNPKFLQARPSKGLKQPLCLP